METQLSSLRSITVNPLTLATGVTAVLGLILVSLGGVLLQLELTSSQDDSGLPVFAQIKSIQAGVRRRSPTRLSWSWVADGDAVRIKDSIHTGPDSGATLILKESGEEIELGPDTLVVLNKTEQLPLQFVSGNALIRSASGEDQKIELSENGKIQITALPVKLLLPRPRQAFLLQNGVDPLTQGKNDSRVVRFEWQFPQALNSNPTAKKTLEVASSSDFKKPILSVPIQEGQSEFETPLAVGRYFWRIQIPETKAGEVRELQVVQAPEIQLTYPTPHQKIAIWGNESPVHFKWRALQELHPALKSQMRESKIEFRSASSESPPLSFPITLKASGGSSLPLQAGKWFARLRYILSDPAGSGDVSWVSPEVEFELQTQEKIPVRLVSPKQFESVELGRSVRVAWRYELPLPENARTEIHLKKGEEEIRTEVPPSGVESLSLPSLSAGIYEVSVSAILDSKEISRSERRALSVFEGAPLQLLSPAHQYAHVYWEKPESLSLQWQKDRGVEESIDFQYQLELTRDLSNNPPIFSKSMRENQWTLPAETLTPGLYFWRVHSVDAQLQKLKTSPIWSFQVTPKPVLAAPDPEKVYPRYNETLDYRVNHGKFKLSWPQVEGAKAYKIKVHSLKTNLLVKEFQTDSQSVTLEGLKEGLYSWSLIAIDQIGRPGVPIEERRFQVSYGSKPPSPRVAELLVGKGRSIGGSRSPTGEGEKTTKLPPPKPLSQEVQ